MTARRLAAGVSRVVTGQELLTAFRTHSSPPGQTFVDPLDTLLSTVSENVESSLRRSDVIELQGPAGSGKTQLLMFLAMTAVLPGNWNVVLRPTDGSGVVPHETVVVVGGKEKGVAWVDCDGRFDALRFRELLLSHLERRVTATAAADPGLAELSPSPEAYDEVIRGCLRRLHVFTPSNSLALAVTLSKLPSYHRDHCMDDELLYIMIDSISAYYWQDQYQAEMTRQSGQTSNPQPMNHVMSSLLEARKALGAVVFMTNWSLLTNLLVPSASSVFPKQHLPSPYPSISSEPSQSLRPTRFDDPFGDPVIQLSHHITLYPSSVSPFLFGISLNSAVEGAANRRAALEEARGIGVTRSVGEDEDGKVRWSSSGRFDIGFRSWGIDAPAFACKFCLPPGSG